MKLKVALSVSLAILFFIGLFFLIFGYNKVMYPLKYEEQIISAGGEFGVDADLIASVINAESGFDEMALLTVLFATVVNFMAHRKMCTIDMVESLKSAE